MQFQIENDLIRQCFNILLCANFIQKEQKHPYPYYCYIIREKKEYHRMFQLQVCSIPFPADLVHTSQVLIPTTEESVYFCHEY